MTPKSRERVALMAGSFNPFTIGHKSLADRGLEMFDRLIIAVGVNPDKPDQGDLASRLDRIRRSFAPDAPVEVISYTGLTVDAARFKGARWLLRGARSTADFDYEMALADTNRNIGGIDTVILPTLPNLAWVSSSVARELAAHGRDITPLLPPEIQ